MNRFNLSESEKKRILSMHNNNILIEQTLSTVDDIKKFQDYMDTLGPWVKNSSGKYVKLNKGAGYGKFGPNTQAAWKVYKNKYLSSQTSTTQTSNTTSSPTTTQTSTPLTVSDGATQSQNSSDCINVVVTGTFPVKVTSDPSHITTFLDNFMSKINENELLKKSYENKTLYVGSINLMGGASNSYNGKTKYEVDNNYQPVTSLTGSFPGNFTENKKLAEKRARGLYDELLKQLPQRGINFGANVTPTFSSVVVDTGGFTDTKRNKGTHPKPGQIVRCSIDLCGVKPKESGVPENTPKTPETNTIPQTITPSEQKLVYSCFENAEIEVNYQGTGHKCNYAVYEIYVNGIKLKRDSGQDYASLNNNGDFDDARKEGEHRFNIFTINKITAEQFVNVENLYKYQGNLQIDAKCVLKNPSLKAGWPDPDNNKQPNGGCHKGVGRVLARVNGKNYSKEARTPEKYGEIINLVSFPACKAEYEKIISTEGNAAQNLKTSNNNNDNQQIT